MEPKMAANASGYIIQSQEEELKRMALELHEGVSQNLYSIHTGLGLLEAGMKDPALKGYTREMTQVVTRTIEEVRLLSVELYPHTLATLGLTSALKSYAKMFTSTLGVVVDIQSSGEEKMLPEPKSMALVRVCQEALINSAKYADVDQVCLRLTWEETSLEIEIQDSGKGFKLEEVMKSDAIMGIASMKERMRLADGNFHVASEPGGGTVVSLFLTI
ncbi:sensor histidine kinase [Shouchella shacheensis]|uniref:sensor histidine kinase n=1 Tax=Shouchella shacheensis TaxID=1649580 RepID=UPI0007400C5A|nr:ATP-binding protein [Shouchella shacheensis]